MWETRVIAGALVLVLGWPRGGQTAEASSVITAAGAEASDASIGHEAIQPANAEPRIDFSSGGGMSEHAKSGYGTLTVGLGRSLERDGWRLRLSGGYGAYTREDRPTANCTALASDFFDDTNLDIHSYCDLLSHSNLPPDEQESARKKLASMGFELVGSTIYLPRKVKVETYDAAIMPGYQAAIGPAIVKVFAGAGYSGLTETFASDHKTTRSSNDRWGPRAAVEAWLPFSDALWLSVDASYAAALWNSEPSDTRHPDIALHTYTATARLGYRALSWLTVGPEAAVFGERLDVDAPCIRQGDREAPSETDETTRMGGFARLHYNGTETTLSGGISQGPDDSEAAYGSASLYVKF